MKSGAKWKRPGGGGSGSRNVTKYMEGTAPADRTRKHSNRPCVFGRFPGRRTNLPRGHVRSLYADRMYELEVGTGRPLATVNVYLGDTRLVSKVVPLTDQIIGYEQTNTYYYHSDHIGNSTLITDYQGQEFERDAFTPHGELWQQDSLDTLDKIDFLFTGKQMDAETGWYNFGKRYLDPKIGLWLSADPALGEYLPNAPLTDEDKKHNGNLPGNGGIYNAVNFALYHFAGNNPIRYTDPDGREVPKQDVDEAFAEWRDGRPDEMSSADSDVQSWMNSRALGPDGRIPNGDELDKVAAQAIKGQEIFSWIGALALGFKAGGTRATAIGATGKLGENALKLLGGVSQKYFKTSLGGRFVDQLVGNVAHESKVGYTALTASIKKQIAKDVELVKTGQIGSSVWHFFRSPITGLRGATTDLLQALNKAGIQVILE